MTILALVSFVAAVLAVIHYCTVPRTTFLPLPPGPRKLPLLGNLLSMPRKLPWVTFARWCQEYESDIIHLNVAGMSIVVLNTVEAAVDLLDKRSSIYSSRPRMVMAKELVGWDTVFMISPYGILVSTRASRRLFHSVFQSSVVSDFNLSRPPQYMIYSVVSWNVQMHSLFGSLTMSITYGIEVQSKNDPYISIAEAGIKHVSIMAVPGAFLVDAFPVLKHVPEWFPGAAFKRLAKEWRQEMLEMMEAPFNAVKRAIAHGDARDSFTARSLANIDSSKNIEEQEKLISETALTAYVGGADTTVCLLSMFILGIISNPDALKTAQEQIDSVCGDSLPTHEDKSRLPYISAIFLETLRWNNIAPLGLPHSVEVEDVYRGYRIPAGSIMVPNVWYVLTYSDPFSFKPERFIKNGMLDTGVLDPTTFAFGFGRRRESALTSNRLCPGVAFAESSAWIAIASMLAVFDIKKSVDESGRIQEPNLAFASSIVGHPEPFNCSIKPRSKVHADRVGVTFP
ncbi:cytochrome P450 [Mycena polygramma]|nr:cytochrome P450 [Mycena polygramma]